MTKLLKGISLVSFFLFFCSVYVFAEEITITTYYPSPYGAYNQLVTNSLGVGDNNVSGGLDSGDAPNPLTNSGDVWIAGNLGIGNGGVSPTEALDVTGTVKATGFQAGAAPGISRGMTVRDAGGLSDCTITVTNGIITASTC